jgi:hypothetical protein
VSGGVWWYQVEPGWVELGWVKLFGSHALSTTTETPPKHAKSEEGGRIRRMLRGECEGCGGLNVPDLCAGFVCGDRLSRTVWVCNGFSNEAIVSPWVRT